MKESFIAYYGNDLSLNDIVNRLRKINNDTDYTVKSESNGKMKMAKIVYDNYLDDREPWYKNDILYVGGYDFEDIRKANDSFRRYDINDRDRYHALFACLYRDCQEGLFLRLSKEMPFSGVVYDINNQDWYAGRSYDGNKKSNLFYGFISPSNNIIFTNNKICIEDLCKEVFEVPEYTYFDGKEFICYKSKRDEKIKALIESDLGNAKNFLQGLNGILSSITDVSLRENVDLALMEYLETLEPKKIIGEYVSKEVTNDLKARIYHIIRKELNAYQLENKTIDVVRKNFDKLLEEYAKKKPVPMVHILKSKDLKENLGVSEGFYHEKFETILSLIQLDEPIMLIGPAGSGKNVAISQVANTLGQHMYYTNNASNEFKLTGFIDAGGNYRDTEFYKAFKNGGLFFLDEIDNSDPSALIVINSALANGYMAFPHETIDRHPNFRIVAAANTWGKGADLQYVGRNALDGATLDRFDNVFFDYDKKLEQALYPNEEVLQFMWSFRNAIYDSKIPHIVSTRGIGKVYKKEINGIPVEDILTTNVIKNLGQDDVNTIIGNMGNISHDNKFYEGIKRLRLRK